MGDFTLILNAMWHDAAFMELSSDAKVLFIWSWTNPQAPLCGLYVASLTQMRKALQVPPADEERVHVALKELARKPLALYDFDAEVLWIVKRAKHANRSARAARCIKRELMRVPPTPLMDDFRRMYGIMLDGLLEAA